MLCIYRMGCGYQQDDFDCYNHVSHFMDSFNGRIRKRGKSKVKSNIIYDSNGSTSVLNIKLCNIWNSIKIKGILREVNSTSIPFFITCKWTKKIDEHRESNYSNRRLKWSGWQDLNPRPTGPKPVALPNCATPRYKVKKQRPPSLHYSDRLKKMVPRSGIEPETRGFSVPCSTY